MPFFDDNFLKDYADIYGSMENPIQFPFRVTEDGHYIFDSKSGKDNVYMNSEGNLVYNSSSTATITNLLKMPVVKLDSSHLTHLFQVMLIIMQLWLIQNPARKIPR